MAAHRGMLWPPHWGREGNFYHVIPPLPGSRSWYLIRRSSLSFSWSSSEVKGESEEGTPDYWLWRRQCYCSQMYYNCSVMGGGGGGGGIFINFVLSCDNCSISFNWFNPEIGLLARTGEKKGSLSKAFLSDARTWFVFPFKIYLDGAKFVMLSDFPVKETTCLKIYEHCRSLQKVDSRLMYVAQKRVCFGKRVKKSRGEGRERVPSLSTRFFHLSTGYLLTGIPSEVWFNVRWRYSLSCLW